jgi:hypothetical protein
VTSASSTGLDLDPNDPEDAKILRRQRKVARDAGRDGLDRAATTRGRADLEAAYDEGALKTATPAPAGTAPSGGKRGSGGGKGSGGQTPAAPSAGGGLRNSGPGWAAFKPTSPTKPPTRLADAGGFLSGVALYMVVVIYIRYGPEGWKGWLSAKFLNKPIASGNSTASGKPKTKNGGAAAV